NAESCVCVVVHGGINVLLDSIPGNSGNPGKGLGGKISPSTSSHESTGEGQRNAVAARCISSSNRLFHIRGVSPVLVCSSLHKVREARSHRLERSSTIRKLEGIGELVRTGLHVPAVVRLCCN